MNTLLLIDGNAIMHRAYHALPPFKTKSGIPTNAIYGFLSILNKAIGDFQPHYIVVSFDTPVPTFRKKLFKEYQSHRPKMENELSAQFPIIKEALDAAQITHLEKEGYEADDVIGTISRTFHTNGDRVLILSGDKDILQLANEKVFVVTPQLGFGKQVIYSPDEVKKRFGIEPKQIPDFKALMGDPSDNYKGAKGIGPKTASKLLQEYGSLENIFKKLKTIDGKIQKILEDHKEQIYMSKQLATILTDVELNVNIQKTAFHGFDEHLKEFLKRYEMYSLINRIFKERVKVSPSVKTSGDKPADKQNQMDLF
jgi:DNA polymerase-1